MPAATGPTPAGPSRPAGLAAVVGTVLTGALLAGLLVVGHHPWDGPVLETFVEGHGLHPGDVVAIVPIVASVAVARRRWHRRR